MFVVFVLSVLFIGAAAKGVVDAFLAPFPKNEERAILHPFRFVHIV